MSYAHHSVEDLESALCLQFPAPPLYQFSNNNGATEDSWPQDIDPNKLSSKKSNSRASSTLFPPDIEDQPPFQNSHRATFRASLATSEIIWLCGPGLKRLTEIGSHDEAEQRSMIDPDIRQSVVRKSSFLSRNIDQSLRSSQHEIQQEEKQHSIHFEITRPDSIHDPEKNLPAIPRPTPSPSDYWDFDNSISNENEKICRSVDPFSIAEGIVEYKDLPTPVVALKRISLNKDCFLIKTEASNKKHCRMMSSPTLYKSDREKDQKAASMRKACILAFVALLLLIALTCLITGCRVRDNDQQ